MSVAELARRIDDARELRLAVLEELRRRVPFDFFAFVLTDPSTQVGADPVADVPCLPELPRLIRLKYATDVNRWTQQTEPVARLHVTTRGRLEHSLVWRELLTDHGVSDVASMVFRDRFGCWAFLDLWRCTGVFTDAHADVLAQHVDTITAALRRCTLRTFARSTHPNPTPRPPGPAVLVLSDQLEVQGQTPETEQYLRALVPPEDDRPSIPAGAYNVAAQLLAAEAGIDAHQPSARVHLGNGDWSALRVCPDRR